jgi:hypothetical protein
MLRATFRFYVDWNMDDDFSDPYEEITDDVLLGDWRLGRDSGSLLSLASSGVANITLKNATGKYSSLNSASPLYGLILPLRKVKITATYLGATTTQWLGFLDNIMPTPSAQKDHTAKLRATGPLATLAMFTCDVVAMQVNITTGAAINMVLDAAGFPAGLRVIDTGQTTMARWWVAKGSSVLDTLREIEATECGFLCESKDGKIVFEDRAHRLAHTSQATYTNTIGAGNINYQSITQEDPTLNIYNVIKASVRVYDYGGTETLWELAGAALAIAAGADLVVWATFPSATSQSGSVAVYNWSSVTYTANQLPTGLGIDMTSFVEKVAEGKYADSMMITLRNNAGSTVYVTAMECLGTAVVERDAFYVDPAEDNLSIADFGRRVYEYPGKWLSNIGEAGDFVTHFLALYKDPHASLTIGFLANRSHICLTEALARNVSDIITVEASTTGTSLGVSGDFYVESIAHALQQDGSHQYEICTSQVVTHAWAASNTPYAPKAYTPEEPLVVATTAVHSPLYRVYFSSTGYVTLDSTGAGVLRVDSVVVSLSGHTHGGLVTNGDSHDHNGGDGGQVAYSSLSGTPTLGDAAAKNVGTGVGDVAVGTVSTYFTTGVLNTEVNTASDVKGGYLRTTGNMQVDGDFNIAATGIMKAGGVAWRAADGTLTCSKLTIGAHDLTESLLSDIIDNMSALIALIGHDHGGSTSADSPDDPHSHTISA